MSFRSVVILAALAAPAGLALADNALVTDPDSLPKISCDKFTYSAALLKRYPKAPAGCQEGHVAPNGTKYAKFQAKVYLNGPDRTTVNMLNVAGDPISTFSFKGEAGGKVSVNGKVENISDLKPGEVITFWIPEKRLEAHSLPSNTDKSWRVLPPAGQ
jgi:ribosomal 50S subunit-recycling heat shock protein